MGSVLIYLRFIDCRFIEMFGMLVSYFRLQSLINEKSNHLSHATYQFLHPYCATYIQCLCNAIHMGNVLLCSIRYSNLHNDIVVKSQCIIHSNWLRNWFQLGMQRPYKTLMSEFRCFQKRNIIVEDIDVCICYAFFLFNIINAKVTPSVWWMNFSTLFVDG